MRLSFAPSLVKKLLFSHFALVVCGPSRMGSFGFCSPRMGQTSRGGVGLLFSRGDDRYAVRMDGWNDVLEARLVNEARRLCTRYIDEVVLQFDLCPWAAPALRAGRVQVTVLPQVLSASRDARSLIEDAMEQLACAARNDELELVLLVFPRCELDRLGFERFQRDLREAMNERARLGTRSDFALAAFHPDAPLDTESPERLIPYLRRSPDPLLQAVRTTTLDRLEPTNPSGTGFVTPEQLQLLTVPSRQVVSLRMRVARANFATLATRGGHIESTLAAIIADRRASYARIWAEGGLKSESDASCATR